MPSQCLPQTAARNVIFCTDNGALRARSGNQFMEGVMIESKSRKISDDELDIVVG